MLLCNTNCLLSYLGCTYGLKILLNFRSWFTALGFFETDSLLSISQAAVSALYRPFTSPPLWLPLLRCAATATVRPSFSSSAEFLRISFILRQFSATGSTATGDAPRMWNILIENLHDFVIYSGFQIWADLWRRLSFFCGPLTRLFSGKFRKIMSVAN